MGFIRRAAGLGSASQSLTQRALKGKCALRPINCWGRVCWLSAALTAGRSGARVVLVDEGLNMGAAAGNTYLGFGGDAADSWHSKL